MLRDTKNVRPHFPEYSPQNPSSLALLAGETCPPGLLPHPSPGMPPGSPCAALPVPNLSISRLFWSFYGLIWVQEPAPAQTRVEETSLQRTMAPRRSTTTKKKVPPPPPQRGKGKGRSGGNHSETKGTTVEVEQAGERRGRGLETRMQSPWYKQRGHYNG